ncbi:MAG TPA: BolA family protein [Methyloradius sp.]
MLSTIEELEIRLATLEPTMLEIKDDSALHAGHTGNTGGGHYSLSIVSSHFYGKSHIIRHRMVYQALADLMTSKIHALSIRAKSPDEL